jgi:hypothetical protein
MSGQLEPLLEEKSLMQSDELLIDGFLIDGLLLDGFLIDKFLLDELLIDGLFFSWPGAEHERSAGASAGGEVPAAVRPEREDQC